MTTKHIVLLHGILRNTVDLAPLSLFLKSKGYTTHPIHYPSTTLDIEQLSDFVAEEIKKDEKAANANKLYFVTHSMGGLITRYYLQKQRPPNLHRVVMIGPPNKGSEFADFFNESKTFSSIFNKLFGPAGKELGTKEKLKNLDNDITYPLGVIAGDFSLNPLAPWVLHGEHDGIVPVENTKIDGMRDHIIVHAPHSLMILSPDVIKQTYYFLEHGHFQHKK